MTPGLSPSTSDVEARSGIEALGLQAVSRDDLLDRVRLWDNLKQRVAVQALLFYVTQVERDSALTQAVTGFFSRIEQELSPRES